MNNVFISSAKKDEVVENFAKSKREELEKMIPSFVNDMKFTNIVLNFYERGIRDGAQMMLGRMTGNVVDGICISNGVEYTCTDTLKQKWSEEDEKKRNLLISILKINLPNGYFKVNPANTLNMEAMHTEELVDWLKSLKERYTWKPSEEQMDALAWALSLAKNCGEECAFDLRTLHEQLKKLKG